MLFQYYCYRLNYSKDILSFQSIIVELLNISFRYVIFICKRRIIKPFSIYYWNNLLFGNHYFLCSFSKILQHSEIRQHLCVTHVCCKLVTSYNVYHFMSVYCFIILVLREYIDKYHNIMLWMLKKNHCIGFTQWRLNV